ncbi:hypothetical protein A8709_33100 [Paenibacillus pectinilyticus]|uniref:N-acetylmuramoyl-L-alanine amidase domain-containing protein n=1 Tax=Paenibacillus pectinilyticus TaxID=512399 RepID=A0A1C0ZX37_9BACL|nr:N-acetylmuramoyl-L-alanine amidase [Paenibacillus pectinilyticus]OCT12650.1 hypothetical protein A8709_33100 [Paenibacillus pectinilyticus]
MPIRNIKVIPNLPFDVLPIQDITDTLPSRLPDPETPRTPEQITHIAVHHSAVEGGTIQGYADYHVNSLKWAHIGYHCVVKGNQIYQTNDLLTFSYHTSSNNAYTVSVSVSGDLSKRSLTDDERNCLYATILTYMDLFKIPVENVWGHNEYPQNNTACPCIDMNQLRQEIKTIQMKMQQQVTWAAKMKNVSDIVNQINYLTGLMKAGEKDGNAVWAANAFSDVADMMRSKHLL